MARVTMEVFRNGSRNLAEIELDGGDCLPLVLACCLEMLEGDETLAALAEAIGHLSPPASLGPADVEAAERFQAAARRYEAEWGLGVTSADEAEGKLP